MFCIKNIFFSWHCKKNIYNICEHQNTTAMKKYFILYIILVALAIYLNWKFEWNLSFWGVVIAPVWEAIMALIIGNIALKWPLVPVVIIYAGELASNISVHWSVSIVIIPAIIIGSSIAITKVILEWLWLATNNERHTTCAACFFYKKIHKYFALFWKLLNNLIDSG